MHVCVFTLYIILAFFVYNEGSSKSCLSSLTLKGGSTAFSKPLSLQGTGDVPTALLVLFSKINPSFFTIKEGSTSFSKPFSPQGTRDVSTALLGAQTASL